MLKFACPESAIRLIGMTTGVLLGAACGPDLEQERPDPAILRTTQYAGCFNGTAFFQLDYDDLARRLPHGFRPMDGSFMGEAFAGSGMLALIYLSCPQPSGDVHRWSIVATPVDDPPFAGLLRTVRWNWYELARFEANEGRLGVLLDAGWEPISAILEHAPFQVGHTESEFSVSVGGDRVLRAAAARLNYVDFEAQSHRAWHRASNGRLLSVRFDFAPHHSGIGGFDDCELQLRVLVPSLADLSCSGVGVTEAVETIDFLEEVVSWN